MSASSPSSSTAATPAKPARTKVDYEAAPRNASPKESAATPQKGSGVSAGAQRPSRRRSASSGAEGGSDPGMESPTFFLFRIGGRQSIIRSPEPQRKTRAASAGSGVSASPRNRLLTPTGHSADVGGATPRRPRRHSTADATITGVAAVSVTSTDDDDDDDPFATLPPLTRKRDESTSPTNRIRQRTISGDSHKSHSQQQQQQRQQQHPDSLELETFTTTTLGDAAADDDDEAVISATRKEKEEICAKIASLTATASYVAAAAANNDDDDHDDDDNQTRNSDLKGRGKGGKSNSKTDYTAVPTVASLASSGVIVTSQPRYQHYYQRQQQHLSRSTRHDIACNSEVREGEEARNDNLMISNGAFRPASSSPATINPTAAYSASSSPRATFSSHNSDAARKNFFAASDSATSAVSSSGSAIAPPLSSSSAIVAVPSSCIHFRATNDVDPGHPRQHPRQNGSLTASADDVDDDIYRSGGRPTNDSVNNNDSDHEDDMNASPAANSLATISNLAASLASSTAASTTSRIDDPIIKCPNALLKTTSSPLHLPKPQSPTITLLQKAREGQLKGGVRYVNHADDLKDVEKPLVEDLRKHAQLPLTYNSHAQSNTQSNAMDNKSKIIIADARYSNDKELASVQPKSIRDYAPGEGSIAQFHHDKHRRIFGDTDFDDLFEMAESKSAQVRRWIEEEARLDAEAKLHKVPSTSPTADKQREWYKDIQKGGEIPMLGLRKPPPTPPYPGLVEMRSPTLQGCLTPPSPSRAGALSPSRGTDSPNRNRTDNSKPLNTKLLEAELALIDDEQRKLNREMAKFLIEDERRRKKLKDEKELERRKHSDNFTPDQKSPIPHNRFDSLEFESEIVKSVGDFAVQSSSHCRFRDASSDGRKRAVALFNFYTSNPKELSMEKGSIIYINRQVDNNWFEGELHGNRGIFPISYVEVVASYEQAARVVQAQRLLAEGQAKTKYHFVAQNPMEMSLRKGEIVVLLRKVDANWYEGKIGLRRGIFPCSYVEVLSEPGSSVPPIIPTTIAGLALPSTPTSTSSRLGALSPQPTSPPSQQQLLLQMQQQMHQRRRSSSIHSNPSDGSRPSSTEFAHSSNGASPLPAVDAGGTSTSGPVIPVKSPSLPLHAKLSSNPQSNDIPLKVFRAAFNYNPQKEDELYLRQGDLVYVVEECDDGWFVGSNARSGRFGTFPGNFVEPQT